MKIQLNKLITSALDELQLPSPERLQIERCRDPKHGDYAANVAMILAKSTGMKPRELAEKIKAALPQHDCLASVEIAGPGFINFTLSDAAYYELLHSVLTEKESFVRSNVGKNQKVHLEYVSANPTGPLHVGHGRGAAYGACCANLLNAVGFDVHREYYVNDAGRQMRILALSIWLRYLEKMGEPITLPSKVYRGEYVIEIAAQVEAAFGEALRRDASKLQSLIPTDLDPDAKETREAYLDAMVDAAVELLGLEQFEAIRKIGLEAILDDIKDDLSEFGVIYDEWFRESQMIDLGLVTEGVNLLKAHGFVYEQEGATWFKATELGDEKDRVLIRANGQPTYFASDVAYHLYKYNKGYERIIDIFGADHHGYIARIEAFLRGLGKDPKQLKILLVQFAILYRGKEKVQMSTRSGSFVTLRALRSEVGNDAARFFYIMRKPEQHLDFDLELAKSSSSDNPVYYIQYAHARICSVWRQYEEQYGEAFDLGSSAVDYTLLTSGYERKLLRCLSRYPEVIEAAALNYEPHLLAHYLQELANYFHTYYNAERFLIEDVALRSARLALVTACQIVLASGLKLLGLSTPTQM